MAKPLSQRAYAKHRDCSPEAVRRAIQSGRLDKSLTYNARGHAKITSAEAADAEWLANTRGGAAADQPGPGDGEADDDISLNEAKRRSEIEKWRQTKIRREADELDLAVRRGELVEIEQVRADYVDTVAAVKSKLLGVPTRIKQRRPHLTADDVAELDELIREALEELADELGDA